MGFGGNETLEPDADSEAAVYDFRFNDKSANPVSTTEECDILLRATEPRAATGRGTGPFAWGGNLFEYPALQRRSPPSGAVSLAPLIRVEEGL